MHTAPRHCLGQKRVSGLLKLDLHVAVSRMRWLLGTELESSPGAASTVSCWAISPAPWQFYTIITLGTSLR